MSQGYILPLNCSLGTYTGHYEPVKEMSDLLDAYEKETGHSVPIHGQCELNIIVVSYFQTYELQLMVLRVASSHRSQHLN